MSLTASVRFVLALRVVDFSFTRIARLRSGLRLDSGRVFILSFIIALIRRVELVAWASRRIVNQGNPEVALVLKFVETRIDQQIFIPMAKAGDVWT